MNEAPPEAGAKPWSRQPPTRTAPRRHAGGVYRTAEGEDGKAGGVPLDSAEAAVVAAVRLAYQVAETQIDRSTRLARRLRQAGDEQVGERSDAKAVDAAERLIQKALLSGLEWWEGSVAEGRCPVKRLAAAEYQMIGTLLGLGPAPHAGQPDAGRGEAAAARADKAAVRPTPAPAVPRVQVVHQGDKKNRRAVRIEAWDIAAAAALQATVYFHSAADAASEPIEAEVQIGADHAGRLLIATPPRAAGGRWKCAVCDDAGVQVGQVEISL
jgi:hypothetical protein